MNIIPILNTLFRVCALAYLLHELSWLLEKGLKKRHDGRKKLKHGVTPEDGHKPCQYGYNSYDKCSDFGYHIECLLHICITLLLILGNVVFEYLV